MLWMKWYQTVFLFIIYNVALLQANSNYSYKYFIPVYLSLILSFFYFYLIEEREGKENQVKFVDETNQLLESESVNK